MKRTLTTLCLALAPMALGACANGFGRPEIVREIEQDEIVALERSKWDLATRDPAAFGALLAPDFLAVELAPSRAEPPRRLNRDQVLQRLPLPAVTFDVGDVRVIRPNADAAIITYRVRGANAPFEAFASSHWARRDGQWVTVFYQATAIAP